MCRVSTINGRCAGEKFEKTIGQAKTEHFVDYVHNLKNQSKCTSEIIKKYWFKCLNFKQ